MEYEAEEKLDLPYEEIIKNVIEESLDYVECPYDAEVNVLLTDNAGIHQINLDMRGIDNPTDVLSFPLEEEREDEAEPAVIGGPSARMLGDIVISVEKAVEQATEYGHSVERELAFLAIHGLLHLLGHDHEKGETAKQAMRAEEKRILAALGISR